MLIYLLSVCTGFGSENVRVAGNLKWQFSLSVRYRNWQSNSRKRHTICEINITKSFWNIISTTVYAVRLVYQSVNQSIQFSSDIQGS